jgi:hypothetical protein
VAPAAGSADADLDQGDGHRPRLVEAQCGPALEMYTGRRQEEVFAAGYTYGWFYPLRSGWDDGDRGITCYIFKEDESKITGSLRGPAPATP